MTLTLGGLSWATNSLEPPQVPNPQTEEDANIQLMKRKVEKVLAYPDTPVDYAPLKRRFLVPAFKLPIDERRSVQDNHRDLAMRLVGTIVFVGKNPFVIQEVLYKDKEFLLVVRDERQKNTKIWYSNSALDLRTPEPRYLSSREGALFVFRLPYRQQRQGMHADNIQVHRAGLSGSQAHSISIYNLLPGFRIQDVTTWSPEFSKLMRDARVLINLRLSNKMAFYFDEENEKICAEYNGRFLGEVEDDVITMNEGDFNKPWITNSARVVGCNIRKGKVCAGDEE